MNSNRPPLPVFAHFATPARRTNTFQGGQRPVQQGKLASSTVSLTGNATPPRPSPSMTKTHLFSPSVRSQSPSSSTDHLLKYDIRRLRASLERKEEQISWWMEKSQNDNEKFEALKTKFEQSNRQNDLTLQCLRSTFDGLSCVNRSISVVFLDEEKENECHPVESLETFDEQIDENVSFLLLSRLNEICVKLTKNVDRLLRSSCSTKSSHPVQRHESNASSISKQSVEDLANSSFYEETIEKLTIEIENLKMKSEEEENRTKVERERFEDELNRCKTAQLTAKIHFDTQEKKLQELLLLKDKQLMSILSDEHDVLRQLLDEKTQAFEQLTADFENLMTKYESEYNRNVDCMIKTDALHDHIRLLSETLAEKEINEEKLTTQQQQMKKLMTLLVPSTPSLPSTKKINEKKTFGRKVKRHLRESFSSLVNHKN